MTYDFSAREIPNQRTALAVHARLRASRCTPFILGRFYVGLLERQLWPTQGKLAKDCGVSAATVSRSIAIASFPREILRAFGDGGRLTHQSAAIVQQLIADLGVDAVCINASQIPQNGLLSVEDVVAVLASGRAPRSTTPQLKLSVARGKRYIRLESPHIGYLISQLSRMEELLNTFVCDAGRDA